MSNLILEVTDDALRTDVMQSKTPVLLDFYADWCGPCTPLAATLEEIAHENPDTVRIVRINIEQNRALATSFEITKLPCLVFMREGQKVAELLGNQPKPKILRQLEALASRE
ncbi:thiol reductase thioredoxin [Corallococcus sp. H22C18031201]|nr:thiol reductase thioredoxin [Corallococcus sp. H22C18031201]